MSENNFVENSKKGRTGELYVLKHINELITPEVLSVKDTSAAKITGKDCVTTVLLDGKKKKLNVEVKTVWNFIHRTNDQEAIDGSLPFELWSSENRSLAGWLPKIIHPENYSRTVQPDVLIFLLVMYENVFACIAFEDVPELLNRLKKIALLHNIDLEHIPLKEEAQEAFSDCASVINNTWYAQFEAIKDIATVTMIDTPFMAVRPDIVSGKDGSRRAMSWLQEHRYDTLSECAVSKIPVDEEFVGRFTGDKADHTLAVINRDLTLLLQEDLEHDEHCIAKLNRRYRFLFTLELMLKNMLAHEYPSREHDGKNYYPISLSYIQKWALERGLGRSINTWFHHIKLLVIFGLIEYYQPPRNTTNPIDIMVNANNDSPDCVGYYCPVEFTRDLGMDVDCRAEMYLRSKVRLSDITKDIFIREEKSFEHVDKSYGNDGRNISKVKEYVFELYCKTMLNMVYDDGPQRPETIIEAVKKNMKQEKRLWTVDIMDTSEKANKERIRQKQYWDEYRRLKNQIAYIANEVYLDYGPLTKMKKYVYESNIRAGTWVVSAPITGWINNERALEFKIQEAEAKEKKRKKKP